ncbi:MAG: Rap1a/Tai family immunity protein [Gammaproteobacteria bacterium]
MKLSIRIKVFIAILFFIPSLVLANNVIDPLSINSDSVNLSTKDFYDSLISENIHKREKSRMYLLGVLDATEGKIWCGYKTVKTVSIREILFEEIEKISKKELQERAAHTIEKILSKKLSCKEKK